MTPITCLSLNPHKREDPCRVLLVVLHCIYESHQERFFLQVKPTNLQLEKHQCMFVFDYYRLSPFNCAVIGKFISSVLAHSTGTMPFTLKMDCCKIGDYGLKQLLYHVFFTIRSLALTTTESKFSNDFRLHLRDSYLTHKSMEELKHVLTLQGNSIVWLDLSSNFHHSTANKYIALKHLTECLSHKNCSLRSTLGVSFLGFTEQHF